ncbi:MAG: N-carbamoyl-L-amino acid amidohydrolase [Nitrospinae bacterium]|nr:N-carbamoyl-L-amino acid amidohydrolase [Nitrospinota bacterium]
MCKAKNYQYTANENRLADVIAAIQVMSVYKFYKLDFSHWATRISGQKDKDIYWKNIFMQHPEFFRLSEDKCKASLVWRRTRPRRYDVDQEKVISNEDYENLSDKARISRSPLDNSDISTLINAAIHLHSEEIANKKDARWWVSGIIGVIGAITGLISVLFVLFSQT